MSLLASWSRIAVGPILGGWVTTNSTWRYVFVGEVIVALVVVALVGWIVDPPKPDPVPKIDWIGGAITASGLGVIVHAILQASEWGWIRNGNSPITPFGFALTPFVSWLGFLILGWFVRWTEYRTRRGLDPLLRLGLLEIKPVTNSTMHRSRCKSPILDSLLVGVDM